MLSCGCYSKVDSWFMIFNLFVSTHLPLVKPSLWWNNGDILCLRREPLVHTWSEPRTNLQVGPKNFEMFVPSERPIASKTLREKPSLHLKIWAVFLLTVRVRKWQSTPMHLGCTSTVPGCQSESTSVAMGNPYESSPLASQKHQWYQWWIHSPFYRRELCSCGKDHLTVFWHFKLEQLQRKPNPQNPNTVHSLQIFSPHTVNFKSHSLPPSSMLTTQELPSAWVQTSAPRDASTHAVPQLERQQKWRPRPRCAIRTPLKQIPVSNPHNNTIMVYYNPHIIG